MRSLRCTFNEKLAQIYSDVVYGVIHYVLAYFCIVYV